MSFRISTRVSDAKMVVVDYSISERYCRNKHQQDMERKRQQILNEDAATDIALLNFCPRLHQAMTLLSRHKVGELLDYYIFFFL